MKKIILFTIILAVICTSFLVAAKVSAFEPLEELIPKMKIPIPQLEPFQKPTYVEQEGKGYIFIPWIAQYVSAMYKYALAIGSIIAVIAVMVGGILYLTSAGAPGRIEQGKNIIIGAITGLLIIIFSYIFLNTINPELINLKPIRIQAVKQEQLTVGAYCKDLGAGFNVVTPSGVKEGTTGNEQYFACNKTYTVKSAAADVIVPEGQQCDGSYCAGRAACVDFEGKKQCLTVLFRGRAHGDTLNSSTFNRYIDEIQIRGYPAGAVGAKITEDIDGEYVIPLTEQIEKDIKKFEKVYFHLEINDSDCYPNYIYALNKDYDIIDLALDAIGCALSPTNDDDYYAVKDYRPGSKEAIWGMPADIKQHDDDDPLTYGSKCETCVVIEWTKPQYMFSYRKPWCQFWDVQDLLANVKNGGTEVNFDIDVFPEDPHDPGYTSIAEWDLLSGDKNPDEYPYMDSKVDGCQSPSSNVPEIPGMTCSNYFEQKVITAHEAGVPEEYEGKTMSCRPIGLETNQIPKFEWSLGSENQACDNLTDAAEKAPGDGQGVYSFPSLTPQVLRDAAKKAKSDGKESLICQSGMSCQFQNENVADCVPAVGVTTKYCYGYCGELGTQPEVKPGDPCKQGQCPPYQGKTLYCAKDKNVCHYGKWADPCDAFSQCAPGFICATVDTNPGVKEQICVKENAQVWQACGSVGSGTNCGTSTNLMQCTTVSYRSTDQICTVAGVGSASEVKVCMPLDISDEIGQGACGCNGSSDCPGYNNPQVDLDFCSKPGGISSHNFCSEGIEGAWCDPSADPKTTAGATPTGLECYEIMGFPTHGLLRPLP